MSSFVLELFHEKTGFAGGLMTAGFGLGAVLWAPLVTAILERTGDIGNAFLFMGALFAVGIVVLSRTLFVPPDGFGEKIIQKKVQVNHPERKADTSKIYDVGKQGMLKLPVFYMMMLSLMILLSCGTMKIAQGSPIIQ